MFARQARMEEDQRQREEHLRQMQEDQQLAEESQRLTNELVQQLIQAASVIKVEILRIDETRP